MRERHKGFSLIELLFAGALFAVFAVGVTETLLTGLSVDRLGEEQTFATQYAASGLEVVRSLQAKDFDILTETDGVGLARQNGEWVIDQDHDMNGKYTRVITITKVHRDGNGNIDEGGGDSDPDTMKVISTVSWRVTPSRSDSVVLETFFTRWK